MFSTLFYNPLYNGLVFLIDLLPNHDAGLAVVILTMAVNLVLFSISKNAVRSQIKLRELEPELAKIKTEVKEKDKQARLMLELYRKHKINPFSMIFSIIIQFPILFALYFVFLKGGLPQIHTDILYSFVAVPEVVNMNFLGILDISQKSYVMAILAGIAQFLQAKYASPVPPPAKKDGKSTFQEDFARSMHVQMKYVFPGIVVVIGLSFPSALPLYWMTRNVFVIGQELVVRRGMKKG